MKTYCITYIAFLVVFLAGDFLWLGRMGDSFYRPIMGEMALPGFRAAPALVFYAIYAAGVVFFAIAPGLAAGGWPQAALRGALFGLCAYATYDLTNQATLRQWSTALSVVDISWGAVITGIAAGAAAKLSSMFA